MGCTIEPITSGEQKLTKKYSFLIELHILIKNLEAKKIKLEAIKEKVEEVFTKLTENKEKIIKEEIIEKISNIFIEYLKPINAQNTESIKEIIESLYDKNKTEDNNLDSVKNYLLDVLENIHDYYSLKEEDEKKIDDYIINKLKENVKIKNKKEELKNQYKDNNYIIKYLDFTKIVKENNIIIDNLAIEYLIYKMKNGLPLDKELYLDDLNFNVFNYYLNKIEVENNNIKESMMQIKND